MDHEPAESSAPQATTKQSKMTPESSAQQRSGFIARKWEAVKATTDATAKALGYAAIHTPHGLFDASRYLVKTHLIKDPAWEAVKENPIPLPHTQAAVELFARKYGRIYPENAKTLKEQFEGFYDEEIKGSQMYHAEDGQAFPYTSVNVTEFAKRLYHEYAKPDKIPTLEEPKAEEQKLQEPKTVAYFTFGSFLNPTGDAQFTFSEYAMHEFMNKMGTVIADLEKGKTPNNYLVYTIGSPTSMYGLLTEDAANKIMAQEDPYRETYAPWYSQFIKDHANVDYIHFWGESQGGMYEIATMEKLLEEGVVTQDQSERKTESKPDGKPYLTAIVDAPEMHEEWSGLKKRLKTNVGFGLGAVHAITTRPDLRKWFSADKFNASIAKQLEQNGFELHISEAEVDHKKRVNKKLTDLIRKGWEYNPDEVKVDLRVGTHDTTMESREIGNLDTAKNRRLKKAAKIPRPNYVPMPEPYKVGAPLPEGYIPVAQRQPHPGSLGKDLIKHEGKSRTFGINMHHFIPKYTRPSELRRWKVQTDRIINLKKYGTTKAPEDQAA